VKLNRIILFKPGREVLQLWHVSWVSYIPRSHGNTVPDGRFSFVCYEYSAPVQDSQYSSGSFLFQHCKSGLYRSNIRSRDSVVGIATGYGLDDRGVGVQFPVGVRIFISPRRPDRLWGPPNLPSNGLPGTLSLGVRRPGREADHSPSTRADV
jgi:hypothetical protein